MDNDKKCGVVRPAGFPYVHVPLDSAHNIRIHLQAGYTGDMSPSTRVVLDALLGLIDGQAEQIRAMEEKFDTQTGNLDERVDELDSAVGVLSLDVEGLAASVDHEITVLNDRVCFFGDMHMSDGIKVGRTYRLKGSLATVATALYVGSIDIEYNGISWGHPAVHFIYHLDKSVITAMPTSEFLEKFELEEVEG